MWNIIWCVGTSLLLVRHVVALICDGRHLAQNWGEVGGQAHFIQLLITRILIVDDNLISETVQLPSSQL